MEFSLLKGHVKAKTDRAFLFEVCNDVCLLLNGQEHWFPAYCTGYVKTANFERMCIPGWLYARKTGMSTYECNAYLHHQFFKFCRDETKIKEFFDETPK